MYEELSTEALVKHAISHMVRNIPYPKALLAEIEARELKYLYPDTTASEDDDQD